MPDVTLPRSSANNGTATPATTGSITAVSGNLLIVVITAIGTNPTIATPTSAGTWVTVESVGGTTVSTSMFIQANNGGGAINPSSVLGGTITGWVAVILEFTATNANTGKQFSRQVSNTGTAIADMLALNTVQTIPNLLFVYAIGRATNVFTPAFTRLGPSGTSGWASILPQVGVQGISQDIYWGSNLAQGVGPWPQVPGTLASSATYKACVAWFNTIASQPGANVGTNINGNEGTMVGTFYQGMVGG